MTIVTATDFKSFTDDFLSSVKNSKLDANDFLEEALKRFSVTKAAIQKRFRSYYKMSISEKIENLVLPTREEFIIAILKAEDVDALWKNLNLTLYRRKGLFDKHFGVSSFERAKAKCMLETLEVKDYIPSISENISLVCSQVLGDGSYSYKRGSIRLCHGEKQVEYAIWKAALFNKAFPTTKPAGNTKVSMHKQGHLYSSWESGRLPSKITSFLEDWEADKLMEELTPFGLMLYFLDDAYICLDTTRGTNDYFSLHVPFGKKAIEKIVSILLSYGIGTTVSAGSNVNIGTVAGAVMFYKNFIEPFKAEIPSCMQYKTVMKI